MRRRLVSTVLPAAAAMLCALPGVAAAHQSNPNFESTVTSISPATPGLKASIIGGDDRVTIQNNSPKDVVVLGYEKEPFLWLKAGGGVFLNQHSPALYLNQDRFGTSSVPSFATATAAPQWRQVAGNGRWDWHDHRMHWMAKTTPSVVSDRSKRTKIFDWNIPLKIGGDPAMINGNLYWRGAVVTASPTGAATLVFGAFVALMLLAGVIILFRRRRSSDDQEREAW